MMWAKTDWNEKDYFALCQYLAKLADGEYREFHKKLITENSEVLGVRMAHLRNLAKEIVKGNGTALFPLLNENSYEQMMLYGLILGYGNYDLPRLFEELTIFIPKINNWAVCDCTISSLKTVKKERERFYQFLLPYLASENEYAVRFAVVTLMNYYTDPAWINQILTLYRNVNHPGHYVKMAVAWAVAEAYIKEREKAEALLAAQCLDRETQNKAIQKIRESYRVTAENKEKVTQWRFSMDNSKKGDTN